MIEPKDFELTSTPEHDYRELTNWERIITWTTLAGAAILWTALTAYAGYLIGSGAWS